MIVSSTNFHPIEVNDIDIPSNGLFAIIPAFNQEQVIGSVVLQTKQHVDRVIVINDGSSDLTAGVAKLAGAEVIHLDYTTGKAYALLLGLQRAQVEKCNVAVVIDACGKHNPMEIERVAGPIINGNADLVIGSRYLNRSEPLLPYEKFDQMVLDSGTIVTDSTSSFLAFSSHALENLDFYSKGLRLNRDLISTFDRQGLKISEVSITLKKDQFEESIWDFPIKVLAAMPAFNEELFIAKTIIEAQQYVDRVLVVDDGSTDATAKISQKLGAIVIQHRKNSGYGAALKTIFEKAKEFDIDALVILDSDGQHDPKDIQALLDRLGKRDVDVVIGSRFIQCDQKKIPKYRIFGMRILDHATRFAGSSFTTDSQSGCRAYSKKAINAIHISKDGMAAGSEILIQIAENDLKIAELPINVRYDIEGTSSQNPVKHGFWVIYNLIGLISYRRPLPAFGIPGCMLLIIGFFMGSLAITEYYSTNTFPFVLTMVGGVFLMMGLLLIIAALILNYLVLFVKDQKLSS